MNIAIRTFDNMVKNVYVKLLFWFLLGVCSAVFFFRIIRSDN
ncbi:MAG TPA: hypothetical protein VGM31_06705 [Puia sp.]